MSACQQCRASKSPGDRRWMLTFRNWLPVLCLTAIHLLNLQTPDAFAQTQAASDTPNIAALMTSPEDSDFTLLTAGLGPEIYMRAGHSLLRVRNVKANFDILFNWGLFDFNAPGFALNFFKGRLTYMVGFQTLYETIQTYRDFERRPLWEDRLNLTAKQKAAVLSELAYWVDPAHRTYAYSIRYDNCSTKIRDILDKALSGKLKKRLADQKLEATFRTAYRDYMRAFPVLASLTDILWSGDVDRPMTAWEQSFQPEALRTHLLLAPALDDDGQSRGIPLMQELRMPVKLPATLATRGSSGYALLVLLFVASAAAALLLNKNTGSWLSRSTLIVWGLFSTIVSLLMLLSWAFSDHPELKANANLWLLWPLDFGFFWAGVKRRRGRGKKLGDSALLRIVAFAHIVFGPVIAMLWVLGVVQQDLSESLCALLPWSVLTSLVYLTVQDR